MNYALYAIAGLLTLGALLVIGNIGKERKPTTPGGAVLVVVLIAAEVTVLILAARRLG